MRTLYLKLATLFFLLFGIVAYLIHTNQKQISQDNPPPFYHQIKSGEWYGSIKISELVTFQSEFVEQVINPFFAYDEAVYEIIKERLKELGLYHSTIYFSGTISKSEVFAYIPLNNPKALAKELASTASTLDWNIMDTLQQTIFTIHQNDITVIQTSDVLILTNTKNNTLDYFVENEPKRFVDLDTLFTISNQFAVQTPLMHSLGINYINILIEPAFPFQLNGSINTTALFPFSNGTHSAVLKQQNGNYQAGSSITIDTALFTPLWYGWFDKMQSKYGFPFGPVLKAWDGSFYFAKGGTIVNTDTIVSFTFDDNFNEVKTKKIVENNTEGFSFMMGSENTEKLINALQENNFLSLEKEKYFFPMSPPLLLERSSDQLILSSYKNQEVLKEKHINSFFIHMHKEGWFIRADIDRKSDALVEFDVSIGVLEE